MQVVNWPKKLTFGLIFSRIIVDLKVNYKNMTLIAKLILNAFTVFVACYIVPGIVVDSAITAIIVGIVLGIINSSLKPLLQLVSLPLTVMTLGIFGLIINGLMVLLVAWLVPGFTVSGLLAGILFSLVVSLVGAFLNNLS